MATNADVSCGQEITESVTLTDDLGPCVEDGLVITADGITVDLNGHTIIGCRVMETGRPRTRWTPTRMASP